MKPLGLVERSLGNDFLLKEHGSLNDDKFLTPFVFAGTLSSPFSGIHISYGIFQVFLFNLDVRLSLCELLGGSIKVVVTILSLGDYKTLAKRSFTSIGLMSLIPTASKFIPTLGVGPIVVAPPDMNINLIIYRFIPLD